VSTWGSSCASAAGGTAPVSSGRIDARAGGTVRATERAELPAGSVFPTVEAASAFFRLDSVGYSPTGDDGFDGVELDAFSWNLCPLEMLELTSSFFDDSASFPAGSVTYDSAFLMRRIDVDWHARPNLTAGLDASAARSGRVG